LAERSQRLREGLDEYRRRLMLEPWGATGLEGGLLVAPVPGPSAAAAGLVFLRADGYPERSGRTALAAASWLWRTGRAQGARPERAGRVTLEGPQGPLAVAIGPTANDASPLARIANPLALEVQGVAGVRVVRVGGGLVAIALAPEGGAGLDPAALGAARARLTTLRAALTEAVIGSVAEWLLVAPPAGDGAWAVAGFDRQERLERAPTFEGLAALSLHLAAEGRVAPGGAIAVRGLAEAAAVTVHVGAGPGPEGCASEVEARAFVIALRRFALDPDDEVAPFLLP
jgi:proline racemase